MSWTGDPFTAVTTAYATSADVDEQAGEIHLDGTPIPIQDQLGAINLATLPSRLVIEMVCPELVKYHKVVGSGTAQAANLGDVGSGQRPDELPPDVPAWGCRDNVIRVTAPACPLVTKMVHVHLSGDGSVFLDVSIAICPHCLSPMGKHGVSVGGPPMPNPARGNVSAILDSIFPRHRVGTNLSVPLAIADMLPGDDATGKVGLLRDPCLSPTTTPTHPGGVDFRGWESPLDLFDHPLGARVTPYRVCGDEISPALVARANAFPVSPGFTGTANGLEAVAPSAIERKPITRESGLATRAEFHRVTIPQGNSRV